MDRDEVEEGGEGGLLGSTVGAICGEEDGEEVASLEEASWVHLNFSKSDWRASICDNRLVMVGPEGS